MQRVAWGDRSGPNRQGRLIGSPSGAICRYVQLWYLGSPPILHFFHSWHRSRLDPSSLFHPLLSLFLFFLFLLCSRMGLCTTRRTLLHISFLLLSLAFPFSPMNPSCMRLFPHVVLIIYTFFHFSAPFFSALPISQARFSYLPPYPLICAAMHRHFPEYFTYPLSLQSLAPLKQAWALGLPALLNHHVNPPKKRLRPCVHKTIALFGATRK